MKKKQREPADNWLISVFLRSIYLFVGSISDLWTFDRWHVSRLFGAEKFLGRLISDFTKRVQHVMYWRKIATFLRENLYRNDVSITTRFMLDGDPLQKFISAVSSPETDSRIVGKEERGARKWDRWQVRDRKAQRRRKERKAERQGTSKWERKKPLRPSSSGLRYVTRLESWYRAWPGTVRMNDEGKKYPAACVPSRGSSLSSARLSRDGEYHLQNWRHISARIISFYERQLFHSERTEIAALRQPVLRKCKFSPSMSGNFDYFRIEALISRDNRGKQSSRRICSHVVFSVSRTWHRFLERIPRSRKIAGQNWFLRNREEDNGARDRTYVASLYWPINPLGFSRMRLAGLENLDIIRWLR